MSFLKANSRSGASYQTYKEEIDLKAKSNSVSAINKPI